MSQCEVQAQSGVTLLLLLIGHDYYYMCRTNLEDSQNKKFIDVEVKDHAYRDPVQKLYWTVLFNQSTLPIDYFSVKWGLAGAPDDKGIL